MGLSPFETFIGVCPLMMWQFSPKSPNSSKSFCRPPLPYKTHNKGCVVLPMLFCRLKTFSGRFLFFFQKGGFLSAPQIPHEIHCIFIIFLQKCSSCGSVCVIHIGFSPVSSAFQLYAVKVSVAVKGYTAVIQKISITTAVHASLFIQNSI